ncbi:MAG TPA: hypothetical protein VF376_13195 [Thermoanaerobaculia bacterium]
MTIQQQLMAALMGVVVFVLFVVLGEIALRLAGHQIAEWLASGIPLTGWRQVFASVTNFFSRYFWVMSPLVLLACVSAAVALARGWGRRAA